jgi:hypothetical protein
MFVGDPAVYAEASEAVMQSTVEASLRHDKREQQAEREKLTAVLRRLWKAITGEAQASRERKRCQQVRRAAIPS